MRTAEYVIGRWGGQPSGAGSQDRSRTLLLRQGVHPKIISERLGHASIAITLDTYSHVVPGLQAAAAAQLDALLEDPGEDAAIPV